MTSQFDLGTMGLMVVIGDWCLPGRDGTHLPFKLHLPRRRVQPDHLRHPGANVLADFLHQRTLLRKRSRKVALNVKTLLHPYICVYLVQGALNGTKQECLVCNYFNNFISAVALQRNAAVRGAHARAVGPRDVGARGSPRLTSVVPLTSDEVSEGLVHGHRAVGLQIRKRFQQARRLVERQRDELQCPIRRHIVTQYIHRNLDKYSKGPTSFFITTSSSRKPLARFSTTLV